MRGINELAIKGYYCGHFVSDVIRCLIKQLKEGNRTDINIKYHYYYMEEVEGKLVKVEDGISDVPVDSFLFDYSQGVIYEGDIELDGNTMYVDVEINKPI